jgi:hypothetical protein
LAAEATALLGVQEGLPARLDALPAWLREADENAEAARTTAAAAATVQRVVFLGIIVVFIVFFVLSDIACRGRLGQVIEQAEREGAGLEGSR